MYLQQSGTDIQYQYNSTAGTWTTISSWPLQVANSTPALGQELTVSFFTNLTITNNTQFIQLNSAYLIIDGNNNTVTYDSIPSVSGLLDSQGGYSNITVQNIKTAGISSAIRGGGICKTGFASAASNVLITNCSNSVPLGYGCGGICDYNTAPNGGSITITKCFNTGNFTDTIGSGIIGASNGFSSIIISNCYNTGNFTKNGCAGIAASCPAGMTISNCYNWGQFSALNCFGITATVSVAGGVTNCYNSAVVTAGNFGISQSPSNTSHCYDVQTGSWNVGTAITSLTGVPLPSNGYVGSTWTSQGDVNPFLLTIFNPTPIPYTFNNWYIRQSGSNIQYQKSLTGTWTTISSWPFVINNPVPALLPLNVNFTTGITITSDTPYFSITSQNVVVDGNNYTVTINGFNGYSGLFTNTTNSNITIKNFILSGVNNAVLKSGITRNVFGSSSTTGIVIDNCVNNIPINNYGCGICINTNGVLLMKNCINNGEIRGSSSGLIRQLQAASNVTIQDCINNGRVSDNYCGGVFAGAAKQTSRITLLRCSNTGEIAGQEAGGIIGVFTNCICTVRNCFNTGNISGIQSGGITADGFGNDSNNTQIVENCYNTGAITGQDSGGILGPEPGVMFSASKTPTIHVTNCYNTGSIASTCGGIIGGTSGDGYDHNPIITMTNCYNNGSVVDTGSGLISNDMGVKNAVVVTNCYSPNGAWNFYDGLASLTNIPLPSNGFAGSAWTAQDTAPFLLTSFSPTPIPYQTSFTINNVNYQLDLVSFTGAYVDASPAVTGPAVTIVASLPDNVAVTQIAPQAFQNNSSIQEVLIPSSVLTIGAQAFANNNRLFKVTIDKTTTSIALDAFSGCTLLRTPSSTPYEGVVITNATLGDYVYNYFFPAGTNGFYVNYGYQSTYTENNVNYIFDTITLLASVFYSPYATGDVTIVSQFTVDTQTYTVNEIGFQSFYQNANITSFTVPDSIENIDVNAFYGCTGFSSFTCPASLVQISNSAFYGCSGLVNITYNSGLQTVQDSAFQNCTSLLNGALPSSVTSLGNNVFTGCTSLVSVTIPPTPTLPPGSFQGCENLVSVSLPATMETLGASSFAGCASLPMIELPANLTTIENDVFSDCVSLSTITIPDGVTTIGDNAFSGCISLTDITLSNSLTDISPGTFDSCSALPIIVVPDSVATIGDGAFTSCTSLTDVTLSNNLTDLGANVFDSCTALPSIVIPDSVSTMGQNVFSGCTSLTDVTLSTSLDTVPAGTFDSCTALPSIVIPGGIGYIDQGAFMNCSSLTDVTLPGNLNALGASVFDSCTALPSIVLPTYTDTLGEGCFQGCTSLTDVTLNDAMTNIGASTFASCTALPSIVLPDSVTTLGDNAFSGCTSLTDVTLSNSLTDISPGTFDSCSALPTITIPDSVTTIGDAAFINCTSLTDVTLSNTLTTIGNGTFNSCSELPTITIPDSVTSIGDGAFLNCISLTDVTLPAALNTLTTSLFQGCEALPTIVLPDALTTIGESTFQGCVSLDNVIIPPSVETLASNCFTDCTSLTSMTLSDAVTTIGDGAFQNCSSLTSIDFGAPPGLFRTKEFQLSGTTIGPYAFYGTALTSVIIPSFITSVGDYAFANCPQLKTVVDETYISNFNTVFDNILENVTFKYSGDIPSFACQGFSQLKTLTMSQITSVGSYSFNGTALQRIYLPASCASIQSHAFANCSSLYRIDLNYNSVVPLTVGNNAFENDTSLAYITIPNRVTSFGVSPFNNCPLLETNVGPPYAGTLYTDALPGSLVYDYFLPPGTNGFYLNYEFKCFLDGTKILIWNEETREEEYMEIQHMRKGTLVKTSKNGYKKVEEIGYSFIQHYVDGERTKNKLYQCNPGEFHNLIDKLVITGCHALLVDSFKNASEQETTKKTLGDIFVTEGKYRLPAFIDTRMDVYEVEGKHKIWHFALENESIYKNYGVYANGILVETTSLRMMRELCGMTLL